MSIKARITALCTLFAACGLALSAEGADVIATERLTIVTGQEISLGVFDGTDGGFTNYVSHSGSGKVDQYGDGYVMGSTGNNTVLTLQLTNQAAGDYILQWLGGAKSLTAEYTVTVTGTDYSKTASFHQLDTVSSDWTPVQKAALSLPNLPAGDISVEFKISSSTSSSGAGNFGHFKVTSAASSFLSIPQSGDTVTLKTAVSGGTLFANSATIKGETTVESTYKSTVLDFMVSVPEKARYTFNYKTGSKDNNCTLNWRLLDLNGTQVWPADGTACANTITKTGAWDLLEVHTNDIGRLAKGNYILFEQVSGLESGYAGNWGDFSFACELIPDYTVTVPSVDHATPEVTVDDVSVGITNGVYTVESNTTVVVTYTAEDGYEFGSASTSSVTYANIAGNKTVSIAAPTAIPHYTVSVPGVAHTSVDVTTNSVTAGTTGGDYSVLRGTEVIVTYTADAHYTLSGEATATISSIAADATITGPTAIEDAIWSEGSIITNNNNEVHIADGENSTGKLVINSGTYTTSSYLAIGCGKRSTGTLEVNGGSCEIGGAIYMSNHNNGGGSGAVSYLTISGGSVSASAYSSGWSDNSISTVNISGTGSLTFSGDMMLACGGGNTNLFIVSDSGSLSANNIQLGYWGNGSVKSGAMITMTGGSITAKEIRYRDSTRNGGNHFSQEIRVQGGVLTMDNMASNGSNEPYDKFILEGGTLRANSAQSAFIADKWGDATRYLQAYLTSGTIDTQSYNVTIPAAISGESMAFTKTGTGTLTFTGTLPTTGTIAVAYDGGSVVIPNTATGIEAGTNTKMVTDETTGTKTFTYEAPKYTVVVPEVLHAATVSVKTNDVSIGSAAGNYTVVSNSELTVMYTITDAHYSFDGAATSIKYQTVTGDTTIEAPTAVEDQVWTEGTVTTKENGEVHIAPDNNTTGKLVINGGTTNITNYLSVAPGANSVGTLEVKGGTVTIDGVLYSSRHTQNSGANSYSHILITNATVNATGYQSGWGAPSTSILDVLAGGNLVLSGELSLSSGGGNTNYLNLAGGTITTTKLTLNNYADATAYPDGAIVKMTGGTFTVLGETAFSLRNEPIAFNQLLEISGGVFSTTKISSSLTKEGIYDDFKLCGGTLQAAGAQSAFIANAGTHLRVYLTLGTIDTQSYDVTIPAAILTMNITKTGTGTLTFTGSLPSTGTITVAMNGGSVVVAGDKTSWAGTNTGAAYDSESDKTTLAYYQEKIAITVPTIANADLAVTTNNVAVTAGADGKYVVEHGATVVVTYTAQTGYTLKGATSLTLSDVALDVSLAKIDTEAIASGATAYTIAADEVLDYTGRVTKGNMDTALGIIITSGGKLVVDTKTMGLPGCDGTRYNDGTLTLPKLTLPTGAALTNCVSAIPPDGYKVTIDVAKDGLGYLVYDPITAAPENTQVAEQEIADAIAKASATTNTVEVKVTQVQTSINILPGVTLDVSSYSTAQRAALTVTPYLVVTNAERVAASDYYVATSLQPDTNGKVIPKLNAEVVRPAASAMSLGDSLSLTPSNVKKGLYYSLGTCTTPDGKVTPGALVQATGDTLELTSTALPEGENKVIYYRVTVQDTSK